MKNGDAFFLSTNNDDISDIVNDDDDDDNDVHVDVLDNKYYQMNQRSLIKNIMKIKIN
jgi:hypothetical protein